MLITDFNLEFRKYIDFKKLSKFEKGLKIKEWTEKIEDRKKHNRKISAKKANITKAVKNGKMDYITATKQYNLQSSMYHLNSLRIKEFKNYIKIINNKEDSKIEIVGLFCRLFVKKSYLINLKNPASYILKKDIVEVESIVNSPSYNIENNENKRRGIESQQERLYLNLQSVVNGDKKNTYPIRVTVTPFKITLM